VSALPRGYRLVPAEALSARIAGAARLCRERGLAGLLATHATDVYYLSGTMQQGAVFVSPDGRARVFMRRHLERAREECPLEVEPVSGYGDIAGEIAGQVGSGPLGLMLDVMPAARLASWQKRLPAAELADASRPWLEMLAVKDPLELELILECGALTAGLYAELPEILVPGRTELEAAGELLARAMGKGALNLVRARAPYVDLYAWHLVSGPEANRPSAVDAPFSGLGPWPAFPLGAGHKRLTPGEPIIVDVGLCLHGYLTDQTRTYCLGPAPRELHQAHQCLEEVQRAILERLRPGAVSGEIFAAAVETARGMGYGESFLGPPDSRIRFVGHGVGLELGSQPYLLQDSPARVRAGEVYALELKIVLPAGPVGLENTVAVAQSGPPQVLTPIPEKLHELPHSA
jgi:Xaa-Pro aminopeptidase